MYGGQGRDEKSRDTDTYYSDGFLVCAGISASIQKNVKGADKVGKELKSYSDEIAALDQKMLKLRNRIESI